MAATTLGPRTNRQRAKQFGLDLGSYAIGGVFSPEVEPRGTTGGGAGANAGAASATLNPQPFNLNTVTRGVNTGDFYLSVPSAVVRFLEQESVKADSLGQSDAKELRGVYQKKIGITALDAAILKRWG